MKFPVDVHLNLIYNLMTLGMIFSALRFHIEEFYFDLVLKFCKALMIGLSVLDGENSLNTIEAENKDKNLVKYLLKVSFYCFSFS